MDLSSIVVCMFPRHWCFHDPIYHVYAIAIPPVNEIVSALTLSAYLWLLQGCHSSRHLVTRAEGVTYSGENGTELALFFVWQEPQI